MDYEEFRKIIDAERKRITGLDVPEGERQNLYNLVDETVERFEELKVVDLNNQIALAKLRGAEASQAEAFENLEGDVANLSRSIHILGNRVQRAYGE